MRSVFALALTAYKYCLSPFLPPACRFHPTCSEYAKEAVLRFGIFKGGMLAACRLARCNPLFKAGVDPVPETYPALFHHKQAHLPPRKTRSQ